MGKIRLRSGVFLFLIFSLSFSVEVWGNIIPCPVSLPLDRLTLAGTPFDSNGPAEGTPPAADRHFCVRAHTDDVAEAACSAANHNNHVAVNPGNPQYGVSDTQMFNNEQTSYAVFAASFGASVGATGAAGIVPTQVENTRTSNTLGVYFCVPRRGFGNSKKLMCLAGNETYDGIIFHWGPFNTTVPDGEDSDCYCQFGGQTSVCTDAADLAAIVARRDAARDAARDAPTIQDEPEAEPVPSAAALDQFRNCIDTLKGRASRCAEAGRAGARQCNANNGGGDSLLGGAAQAAGGMAAAHNQSNIGTGAQDSCFQASLLSNAALYSANSLNNDCSDNLALCNDNCGEEEGSNYFRNEAERTCLSQLNNNLPEPITMARIENSATASETTTVGQAAAYYQGALEEGNRNFVSGRASCRTARQSRSTLENLISGVGRSLQSAAQCSCQYASSTANTAQPGTSNACASNLPNPNDCATNPTLPGCEVYRELSPCTPGATYNAQMCRCQTNPSATGCEGTQTTGAVASMAGSMIKAGAVAGPTGFGIPAGAVARNGIDLGGGSDGSSEGLQLDNKNGRAQLPKDPSVAGGGGAPPGGGATRDNGALAGGAGEEKSLAAGLMNAAKNVAKALGLKSGDKANGNLKGGKIGTGGKDPNFNSFRPRNVAGGSNGMGGKHMDIWKMMNKCVQAEICQSNMNNYILTP